MNTHNIVVLLAGGSSKNNNQDILGETEIRIFAKMMFRKEWCGELERTRKDRRKGQ